MFFVVADADKAVAAWEKAGIPTVPPREYDIEVQWRGKPGRVHVRSGAALFENVIADFSQPLEGDGPFAEFLARTHGGGFGLVHNVPDEASLEAEVKRLNAAGVRTLYEGNVGGARFAFMDTIAQGKYALGLVVMPSYELPKAPRTRKVTQFAFVARDLAPVSAYWAKIGLPAMTYSHSDSSELIYRGKPGAFDMNLGWQRHGSVPYEWIQPLRGPSAYHEQLDKHGEGFHHLAFQVEDMDRGIKEWEGFGFPLAMAGAWGAKGKPGSGRFAYHDLDACCGSEIELLWSFRGR